MATTDAPRYNTVIHKSAQRELHQAPVETAQQLRQSIHEAATYPQPTMHPDIRPLRGTENLFRVRQGQYRALCDLRPPTLRVLLVHERDGVYSCIEQAQSRR